MADETKDQGPGDTSKGAPPKDAKKTESLAESVGLSTPPAQSAKAASEKTSEKITQVNSMQTGALQSDITRILDTIKLPERRDFRGVGEVGPQGEVPKKPTEPDANIVTHIPRADAADAAKKNDIVTPLHTLKDDLQNVVQEQKISLVRAAALEQDKRAGRGPAIAKTDAHSAQRSRIVRTIAIAIALVLIGSAAIAAVFKIMSARSGSTTAHEITGDPLLFSEQTVPLPIQNRGASELKRMLGDARVSAGLTLGAITRIAPIVGEPDPETGGTKERLASTGEFLSAIAEHVPQELLRALGSDFFFGFHTVDENAPILILPVTSYERAFAGMLSWESTMNADLSPIFTPVSNLVQEEGLIQKRSFDDLVMRNYDVRALPDDGGEVQLYYSFPTRDLLIIAESPYSFTEILSRLRADRRI